MSDDVNTATAGTEEKPSPLALGALSYDFQELEKASAAALGEKDPAARDAALGAIALDQALNRDVVEGMTRPAVPEGQALREVELPDGSKREQLVDVTHEAEKDAPATSTRRRKPADTDNA